MNKQILYCEQAGPANSASVIAAAVQRAEELGLRYLVVASTTGDTAEQLRAAVGDRPMTVVCVTYHAGFKQADDAMPPERRAALRAQGIELVIASHALSGVERSINNAFGTIGPVEMIAHAFRRFGQGIKVAIEVAVMAADAAAAPTTEDIVALGGTGKGCDAAIVLRAAHQNNFFDLRVKEIIAMVNA
ncbi:MAG: pyruvate kinase alpha/beta domain-containing protein [Armatimonadia bacterium]